MDPASPLKGLRVAIVGKFSVWHVDLKALIEQAGGTVIDYVDRTTSLLVAGEPSNYNDPDRPEHKTALYIKTNAARQNGVRIVSEEEFTAMVTPMFRDPQEELVKSQEFLKENEHYGDW